MKFYTWYVNTNGDIQVYEGCYSESLICNFKSKTEAINHMVDRWDKAKEPEGGYPKVKYYIPEEYAKAFFTCIGSGGDKFMYECGTTNVDVSEFLDD